ncbi:hypothetical protein VTO42DRAFT_503 [Malbranchea cinnamomea]
MGAEGLKIVRFRGRFFTFLNEWDSCPDRFEWLEEIRSFYARIIKELEDHVLTITEGSLSDRLEIQGLELYEFPGSLMPGAPSRTDWTYTIDLDREIFSVMDSAHFKLDSIPRDGMWLKALKEDDRGRYTIDLDVCPPESVACPVLPGWMDPQELALYRQKYQDISPSIVNANAHVSLAPGSHHVHQCLLTLAYIRFCESYYDNFTRYSLTWAPDEFVFRELAFAMLSLASGQVRFGNYRERDVFFFDGHFKECVDILVEEGKGISGSKSLPIFANGGHLPGEQPGSAPTETIYWFDNVLVCLATNLDDRGSFEAHIARAVSFGLEQDVAAFEGVVLDLLFCVLIDVHVKDGRPIVRHTMPKSLFPINRQDHTSTHPAERPPRKDKDKEGNNGNSEKREDAAEHELPIVDCTFPPQGGEKVLWSMDREIYKSVDHFNHYLPGFVALINFFNVAKDRSYRRLGTTQGVFPTEIYNRIVDYMDCDTYHACADISPAFRGYCRRHYRIDNYVFKKIKFKEGKLPILTAIDIETGEEQLLKIYQKPPGYAHTSSYPWTTVIGSERPSVLTQVGIQCLKYYCKDE